MPELASALTAYVRLYDQDCLDLSLVIGSRERFTGPGFSRAETRRTLTNAPGPNGPPFRSTIHFDRRFGPVGEYVAFLIAEDSV